MTRSELIAKISMSHHQLTHAQIEDIVHLIFDRITHALVSGGRVELRGFGTFSLRQRNERVGRNPRTGETVTVASKSVPFFKTGKELRQVLNVSIK